MKKKILLLMFVMTMAILAAGCSAGKPEDSKISDDTILIKQYKGLEIEEVPVTEVDISDDEIEDEIAYRVEETAVLKDVDRAAKEGDTVTIDYAGTIDGKEFDGNQEEDAQVEIGAGYYVEANGEYKGFEEQLTGHKAGDKFEIEVKFPEDYEEETDGEDSLNNKVAVFSIKMKKVQVLEEQKYNDEWVKKHSEKGSKTTAEYKEEVRASLEESMKEDMQQQKEETIRSELSEALEEQIEWVKKPEKEIEAEAEQYKKEAESEAKNYGIPFEELVQGYGYSDEDEFYEYLKEQAEYSIKMRKAIDLIAKEEKIELSDKEYKKSLEELAEEMGSESPEEFEKTYGEDFIKEYLLQQKVIDFMAESAKFVEPSEESTEEGEEFDITDDDGESSSEEELDMDDIILEEESE